jgi:hypothetical protein
VRFARAGAVLAAACGLALAAGAARGAGAAAPPLAFRSELVRIVVGADSVEVQGWYRFEAHTPAAGAPAILYPYPTDARLGGARTVSVDVRAGEGMWRPLAFAEEPRLPGSRWFAPDDLGDSVEVRCVYRQALRAHFARYIVTTTSSWGRPLRVARFEITLPQGARPTRFSHAFRAAGRGRTRAWVYEARDFLPDRDIEVEWRP